MNIPFAKFNQYAQIPLTPEYILKLKDVITSNYVSGQIIRLSDNILVHVITEQGAACFKIVEYKVTSKDVIFECGKADAYTATSLHTGSIFASHFHGKFKTYNLANEEVKLVEESEYFMGILSGKHIYYLDELEEHSYFVKDKKHGPYLIKNSNDVTILEGTYVNDQRDGVWKLYTDTGKIKKTISYNHEINGVFGLTQVFNDAGECLSAYSKIVDTLHGPFYQKGNPMKFYMFGEECTQKTFEESYKDQFALMFSNTNFSVYEEVK